LPSWAGCLVGALAAEHLQPFGDRRGTALLRNRLYPQHHITGDLVDRHNPPVRCVVHYLAPSPLSSLPAVPAERDDQRGPGHAETGRHQEGQGKGGNRGRPVLITG
jgi:hypothetical protein